MNVSPSEGLFALRIQVPKFLLQHQKKPPAPLNWVPFQGVQPGCPSVKSAVPREIDVNHNEMYFTGVPKKDKPCHANPD